MQYCVGKLPCSLGLMNREVCHQVRMKLDMVKKGLENDIIRSSIVNIVIHGVVIITIKQTMFKGGVLTVS